MCGIALIVDGIRIDVSSLFTSSTPAYSSSESEQPLFSVDDIKAALRRRGPDSLGTKKIFLHSHISDSVEEEGNLYISEEENAARTNFRGYGNGRSFTQDILCDETKYIGEFSFIGATLQLRGVNPIAQPLVDKSGNILVYNGEIFGGIHVNSDENDAKALMESLGQCCPCICHEDEIACCGSRNEQNPIPVLLSTIRGPWALVYWQASSKTIWFGRDAFGRRSLLVHWPTSKDPRLLLSSTSPPPSVNKRPDSGEECTVDELFWEELPCAVYSLRMSPSKLDANVIGEVKRHDWTDSAINELISWDRKYIHPDPQNLMVSQIKLTASHDGGLHSVRGAEVPYETGFIQATILHPSETVLIALKEAVMRRTATNTLLKVDNYDNIGEGHAPIAVLFSGGLDSMILAALLDQCLDEKHEIDLLNVSFDNESAPDRISARAGLKELHRISPLRRWKLVEIDAELSTLISETKHVMSLINPAKTFMDLNIGLALWLAAGGDGWVYEDGAYTHDASNNNGERQCTKYKSEAKILLVGSGADEQCAGYGRHKTKYKNGSWVGLNNEMKLDMQRIWKRNLGRDDRCIADNGKEARFPFLDEDVIKTLLSFPLWEIADLDQPSGKGDKKILREVAKMLGLNEAATLPKRAIQFGTRIARESNRKNFGSNRAANQASAGSVEIFKSGN